MDDSVKKNLQMKALEMGSASLIKRLVLLEDSFNQKIFEVSSEFEHFIEKEMFYFHFVMSIEYAGKKYTLIEDFKNEDASYDFEQSGVKYNIGIAGVEGNALGTFQSVDGYTNFVTHEQTIRVPTWTIMMLYHQEEKMQIFRQPYLSDYLYTEVNCEDIPSTFEAVRACNEQVGAYNTYLNDMTSQHAQETETETVPPGTTIH